MKVILTGEQFAKMWNDPTIWDGACIDEEIILFDGVESTHPEPGMAFANAKRIEILSGYFNGGTHDGQSFVAVVKKWLKKQGTASFVVTCSKEKEPAIRAAVKAAGGKVQS